MNKTNLFLFLELPDTAYLAKRVPKKQFLESGLLGTTDKKAFQENVKSVYWEYTLKPSTCPVLPYQDNEREYPEIAVLQVELESTKGVKRLAEVIHRVIPYPLFIGFYTEANPEEIIFSIAPKRFSQAEKGAFVVESFYATDVLKLENLKNWESDFLKSLNWKKLPLDHYKSVYDAWTERFTAYNCAGFSGKFEIGNIELKNKHLDRCREIESMIQDLRVELKKSEFNRQVELNIEIKTLEKELSSIVSQI